ncbi:sugar ABC transporter permease [Phytomonospora sp. NPDC050363]|uniref:carbohydrate ABC transporter permease n=1 Tax=Phytomonospora sp. NPDC050363 TaxID=3155642 RepID=UPI0033D3EF42
MDQISIIDELPKFAQLGIGIAVFVVVVGLLLFLVDKLPGYDKGRFAALVFLLPAGILLLIGMIVPAVRTFLLSFFDGKGEDFVGLDNYGWMFTEDDMQQVLINTLIWVIAVPVVATATGLIYAILIDKTRTEALAKALVFLPMGISFVGAGIIWKFVYAFKPVGQEQIGLLNQIVIWFGGSPQQWLINEPWNTFFLIVVMVWIQTGFATVVLSASIKSIPGEIVEAARLDGVNAWQMFWRVTVPSIRPALIVVVVTMSIAALKLFDLVRTMTAGNFGTSVIANEMYTQAFRLGQQGRGSAMAVVLFLLVTPIIIYQVRAMRARREER